MFDYLVVGSGLAGSLLAWRLIHNGQKVLVVDTSSHTSASKVAAGLINPIMGKRFSKDPRFEILLSSAQQLYTSMSRNFGMQFFFEESLVRIFNSDEEMKTWRTTSGVGKYCLRLPDKFDKTINQYRLVAPFGGYYQSFCGRLEIEPLLRKLKGFFESKNGYLSASVSHTDWRKTKTGFCWKGQEVRRLIFCEGYRAMANPLFSWLPFQPSKGEILTLQMSGNVPDEIVNRGKWLVPIGSGLYRVGTTFQWKSLDEEPTDRAKRELVGAVGSFFRGPIEFKMVQHKAGVRPTTLDKKPFIGDHPVMQNISIFNGFGSKGALTIPWFSERFVDHLINGVKLPPESDIARYYGSRFSG